MRIRNSVSMLALSGLMAAGLTALPAYAQEVLTGRVVDAQGAPLPGARVTLPETGNSTSTNHQGEFTFSSVPAGELTVNVEYLGFPNTARTVDVSSGRSASLVVTLGEDDHALERVVVQGAILDGQARALNQQRVAGNTTSIVSSDAIGRFPDHNIAEALQRVPGFAISRDQGEGRTINLRGAPAGFTSVTVDGVALASPNATTRGVDLDTIPSDIVSAIEVSKTLLPAQDADSVAGSVNLKTRSAFDRRGPQITVDAGASHNEIDSKSDTRASIRASNTFGSQEQFGLFVSAGYSKADRSVDNIESVWTKEDDTFVVEEILFKDYDTTRTRQSYTGAFDYRPTDTSKYYIRGTYSKFEDDENRNQLLLLLADGDLASGATDTTATWEGTRVEKEYRHRTVTNEIATIALGGENTFSGMTVDYQLSFNTSEQYYPQRDQLLYRNTERPDISYDYSDAKNPYLSLFDSGEHLDNSLFGFRQLDRREEDQKSDEWAARINFSTGGELFGNAIDYRFGAAYRDREVTRNEERWRSRASSLAPSQSYEELLGSERSENFGYNLGWKFNPSLVDAYLASIRGELRTDDNRRFSQSIETDFTAAEQVAAIYGQAETTVGKTNIIAGLRVEQTDFSSTAYRFNEDDEDILPTLLENSNDYTTVFPNLTIRHDFSNNLVGRFAATRGINRPKYPDVAPRISMGDEPPFTITRGNPNLKPVISNNLDAGLEYYLSDLGIIAVNVFYKQLEDFAFTNQITGQNFEDLTDVTIVEMRNSKEGHIAGVEFNWQQNFSFESVPGTFGIMANVTLTESEIKLGPNVSSGGRSTAPLEGQSDYVTNLAVFWETDRANIRFSYNDRGDYVDELNLDDAALDLYWEGRSQLDLSASYEFTPNLELYLEAKNLTDTEGVRYYGSSSRVYERERFGRTAFLGARYKY